MTNKNLTNARRLKDRLQARELMFAGWLSFSHPSITETLARAEFDFMLIDMEHSTISIEQGQRIISASQSEGVPCIPRPVSHNNDFIKPILESGADGILVQMVESESQVKSIINLAKYPPLGKRTYGVNRAQWYGFDFDDYINDWNASSSLMLQIESSAGVSNIHNLIAFDEVDAVMIGPLDLAGSLGVPGEVNHPLVIEASEYVIDACRNRGISCGTQLSDVSAEGVQDLLSLGYTYVILGSDLFALCQWAKNMRSLIRSVKG
jgi:2-keto-3-deoxy-L-rhamnonate aldolase RhmA